MSFDDIIRMAREVWSAGDLYIGPTAESLERFAALVVEAERDRIITANASEIERTNAELRRLQAEREEDQGVIAVWRGRTLRAEAQREALLEALRELVECPYRIDEASIPAAGIDAAPQQVVGTMSVALMRLRKARVALAAAEGRNEEGGHDEL